MRGTDRQTIDTNFGAVLRPNIFEELTRVENWFCFHSCDGGGRGGGDGWLWQHLSFNKCFCYFASEL